MSSRGVETRCVTVVLCVVATAFAAVAMAQHPTPSFDSLMRRSMEHMHHGMAAASPSGDPDRDFVRMMVPHHQGAVDMSKALLLYGKDRELQQLAKSIIAEQQNEIQLMTLWLARHPASAKPNQPGKPGGIQK